MMYQNFIRCKYLISFDTNVNFVLFLTRAYNLCIIVFTQNKTTTTTATPTITSTTHFEGNKKLANLVQVQTI